jgi:hypothetical protein
LGKAFWRFKSLSFWIYASLEGVSSVLAIWMNNTILLFEILSLQDHFPNVLFVKSFDIPGLVVDTRRRVICLTRYSEKCPAYGFSRLSTRVPCSCITSPSAK